MHILNYAIFTLFFLNVNQNRQNEMKNCYSFPFEVEIWLEKILKYRNDHHLLYYHLLDSICESNKSCYGIFFYFFFLNIYLLLLVCLIRFIFLCPWYSQSHSESREREQKLLIFMLKMNGSHPYFFLCSETLKSLVWY